MQASSSSPSIIPVDGLFIPRSPFDDEISLWFNDDAIESFELVSSESDEPVDNCLVSYTGANAVYHPLPPPPSSPSLDTPPLPPNSSSSSSSSMISVTHPPLSMKRYMSSDKKARQPWLHLIYGKLKSDQFPYIADEDTKVLSQQAAKESDCLLTPFGLSGDLKKQQQLEAIHESDVHHHPRREKRKRVTIRSRGKKVRRTM